MLEYVRQKYGERRVAQIITFGKLKAKSVVRDVGRVMGLALRRGRSHREDDPERVEYYARFGGGEKFRAQTRHRDRAANETAFEYGKILEGLSRNAGVHAAGVVIADRDLTEYIPLCRDVKGNDVISQYPMGPLNDLGLLKMDFLGLKTLTVIEDTLALIHKREPEFSLKNIPLDDAAAFGLYNRGETIGLFQMESGGMTRPVEAIRCPEARRHHRVDRALSARADGTDSRIRESEERGKRRSNICIRCSKKSAPTPTA